VDGRQYRLALALLTAAAAISSALPANAVAQSAPPRLPIVDVDAPYGVVKEPKRAARMRLLDRERRNDYVGSIGIELRGQSTLADDPKKSYAIETRTPAGADQAVSLLGMPEDADWVLIAGYKDESLVRNFVAYATARWTGHYASRTALVELFLNDRYEGVYLLAEKLKLGDDRIAIDDVGISGGYLLQMISMDRATGREREFYFTTPVQEQPVVYKDPGRDISYGKAAWIRGYVSRFERRLYGKRFRHPRRGYRRYMNMRAAVDFVLLNELFRNADTFTYSTYMYKGVGEKLVLGPLWDFDHTMGNYEARQSYDADFNRVAGWQYAASPWAERLYADPGFREQMAKRWRDLRERGLLRYVIETIDRGAGQLAGAQERNFSRWRVFGTDEAYPADPRTGAPPADYAAAVDYLKWWVRQRTHWIDEHVEQRNFTGSPVFGERQ
jgi:hypothetical protein